MLFKKYRGDPASRTFKDFPSLLLFPLSYSKKFCSVLLLVLVVLILFLTCCYKLSLDSINTLGYG